MTYLLAVYGTLKNGMSNHDLLKMVGAEYITTTVTVDKFSMHCFPHFPAVVRFPKETSIKVEVYELESLEETDSLEGHPDLFKRSLIMVKNINVPVWMYLYTDADHLTNLPKCEGEWK